MAAADVASIGQNIDFLSMMLKRMDEKSPALAGLSEAHRVSLVGLMFDTV